MIEIVDVWVDKKTELKVLDFNAFIAELLAWTLVIDTRSIISSPNLISFLTSRQTLWTSWFEKVLYKNYQDLVSLQEGNEQEIEAWRKEFNATLQQYGD
jgi:hypothetical protein